MTLRELYMQARKTLRNAGVENADFDAALLFEKHTGIKRSDLPLIGGGEPACNVQALLDDLKKRCDGEPLQYLLGEWEFMGLRFLVGPGVLIPRPETEHLAQAAIGFLNGAEKPRLLDLCSGSGCVAVAAAKSIPQLEACCLEFSPDAIRYLRSNLELNGVENRVRVIRGDMLSPESLQQVPGMFDAVTCNPPYIPSGEIAALQREVRCHEPHAALDGGEDGLCFYRAFSPWAGLLRPGGMAAFEVGAGQAAEVSEILAGAGFSGVFCLKDYAGIDRVVAGYRNEMPCLAGEFHCF